MLWLLLWLVPKPLRKGRFFRLAVERQVRMLTDEVGQSKRFPGSPQLTSEMAKRMAIGGVADNLLLVALHASPLWLLMAASDASQGAARFVEDLAEELEEKGHVPAGERLSALDRALTGLSKLSGRLADNLDAPPLETAALKETVQGLEADLAAVGSGALEQLPQVERFANEVLALAAEEERSLLSVLGATALGAAEKLEDGVDAAITGVGGTVKLLARYLERDVLGGYVEVAQEMRKRGVRGSLRAYLRPQRRSWRVLFHPAFLTWTERLVSAWRWSDAPWRLS